MSKDNDATTDTGDEQTTRLSQFEDSLAELEQLVETLEAGNISLEEALARFERGVQLTRACRTLLKNAELRVDQLLADGETVADMAHDTAPAHSDDDADHGQAAT